MLSLELVLEVDRLLQETDLSNRSIAVRLGVSRGVVNDIAAGRRGLYGQNDGAPLPTRCRGCGGLVYKPCRLCLTRQFMARRDNRPSRDAA